MINPSKRSVTVLFIFFVAYLPLQYGAVGVVGLMASEPWPAFVLPGFKNIYSAGDRVTVLQPRFYARWEKDSLQKRRVEEQQLFEGIQPSQLLGFIRTHFRDSVKAAALGPEARRWLRHNLERVLPEATAPAALEVEWARVSYSQTGREVRIVNETVEKAITIRLE